MKDLTAIVCLFFLIICPLFFASEAFGQNPEDLNKETLESLLDELQQTIDEADKRMIAHPRFLEELRDMVERYRVKLRKYYLFEDFADGNYDQNPKWSVISGKFRITPGSRLWSQVYVVASSQDAASSSQEENPLQVIFDEIARLQEKKRSKKQEATTDDNAIIQTLVSIGPAFEVGLTFVSESKWGAMQVVLLGGSPAKAYYRLIYQASPSQDRPIKIIRQRGSRQFMIETATQYPDLDDGVTHRLQWIRDVHGNMRVLIDGKEVLNTVELFYKEEFAGLALVNSGGTYEWGPIQVLQAPVE